MMTVTLNVGEHGVEIEMPVRADGALPYALADVVSEAMRAFAVVAAAIPSYDSSSDDTDE